MITTPTNNNLEIEIFLKKNVDFYAVIALENIQLQINSSDH